MMRRRILPALLIAMLGCAVPARAQGQGEAILEGVDTIRAMLGRRGPGVLGLMGYNMTPDGSTNALQINRTTANDEEGSSLLTLGQLGAGFTLSESFPLWLEGYVGYARYDPRAAFTGLPPRATPLRWNNVAVTIGVGYDIRLAEYLWLRPIFNASLGYAASDMSLFGDFISWRTGRDLPVLEGQHAWVSGLGGSLVLAYYDYQPRRDIDLELRYTQLQLQTIGSTSRALRGRSDAKTVGLWARYRWPTGLEAFGRPVRWVLDGSASYYLGAQEEALGFRWSVKAGGGIEIDVGRYEIGAMGLNLGRIRLIGRYFYGDGGVSGASFGIGMSF